MSDTRESIQTILDIADGSDDNELLMALFEAFSSSVSWRFFTSSEKFKYLNNQVGVGFVSNSAPDSGYAFHHDIYLVSLN